MKVPLVDLDAQWKEHESELRAAMNHALEAKAFIDGPFVREFEAAFASALGARHCVGVSSGTTALHLALKLAGVGAGDEVVVPSHTFFATVEAVYHCGARPIFVDIDPETYTMDPEEVQSAITARTRAIVPVQLYGQCAEMDPIVRIARQRQIRIVEDCAQAHLAEYKGHKAGTIGDAGAFSFFPGKNLGAFGDAGAIVTNNEELAEKARSLVNHGRRTKHEHSEIGYNYRMDGLQGAILTEKLKHLADWTKRRRQHAQSYREALKGLAVELPVEKHLHVYHLFVVRVKDRDRVLAHLRNAGIEAGVHYPIPCHLQPALKGQHPQARRRALPKTEKAADKVLSLPIYPELTQDQIDFVASSLRDALTD